MLVPWKMLYWNSNFFRKYPEADTRGVLWKKVFKACNFIEKEALAQVFSCEFCEISKNTFFTKHLWKTASEYLQ